MAKGLGALPIANYISARNNAEANLKRTPKPAEMMDMARQHTYAAQTSIDAKDHSAAADHLAKAAVLNSKASQFYKKNSACYIDKAMKGK